MKRLAIVAIATIVVTGIGPATAGMGGDDSESWCADHASWDADVSGPGGNEVVVGGGATRDKPVQSAFVCIDGSAGRRYHVDALVTGWIDTEYGRAGWSCARQPAPQARRCQRTSVPLPGRSSGRADSTENAWTVDLLGAGVAYDLEASRPRTATRTPAACARDICQDSAEYGAWADTGPADAPPPDPRCGEQCTGAAAHQRSDDSPGAGVEGTPAPVSVGPPPSD